MSGLNSTKINWCKNERYKDNFMETINIKKTSLIVVGIIWFLVGTVLSIAGVNWMLQLGFGPKLIVFLTPSVLIGILKGKFVLKKAALRYYKRADVIKFNNNDIFLGWVKILGVKSFILIALMMVIGSFLRHSNIDRPILGTIYLAVGIALLYASKIFFNTDEVK